ncbi:uncharacterized protein MYCFIDRAFT_84409 [Pseudocercospora fijiensis CIRAD86]|uniref:Uncharacterized protein n=1 Tax=Pseudocercospora fijiensis (strain CIRAD86) TaxID=383855 RepID=M2ZCZ7_PSEFD|nr:uncharacterized protein MYCFIDRAFT_84409 [Pseudocercospora fijiensis CIRAD86]EME76989.1 hypothetical protein MYCFIDRAFT_84409 [Pseudocercospora fijiensis CIRAD86]
MPPRTRHSKHRKAMENIDFTDADYTDNDHDAFSSDEDDFVLAFGNLSVNAILEGRRFTWPKKAKALIVQHALAGDTPFAAHSLPTPYQLLTLGQALELPLNRGKEVAKICIDKLVAHVQNTLSPKGLPGLIEERRRSDGSWHIAVSKALIKEARRDTFTWHSITSGDVAEKHADCGRKFREIKNGNDTSKTALVKETMDLLVRGDVITKSSKTSPMKAKPDLSWLKSPPPGPAATSPMPLPAIGKTRKSGYYGNFIASDTNYACSSDSGSESEPQSVVVKSKTKTKTRKPQEKMPSANANMDESPTPMPKKSTTANKYKYKSIKAGGAYNCDSEDEIIPPKQSKSSSASAKKDMSYSVQSDSEDEMTPPKLNKITSAKKYKSIKAGGAYNYDSEDEIIPPKQSKSSSAHKDMSYSVQSHSEDEITPPKLSKPTSAKSIKAGRVHKSDSEDEITPPKLNKLTSAKKYNSSVPAAAAAAAAADDFESENETPVPKQKKSVNRKDKVALLVAAAQSESEAGTVPKPKFSPAKQVQGTSRKQKHVFFNESDGQSDDKPVKTNTGKVDQLADGHSTSSKTEQNAALNTDTASDDSIPQDTRSYIHVLKACGLKPAEMADKIMQKMADEQGAALNANTGTTGYTIPEHLHTLVHVLKACGLTPAEIADTLTRKMADEKQAAASKSMSDAPCLLGD